MDQNFTVIGAGQTGKIRDPIFETANSFTLLVVLMGHPFVFKTIFDYFSTL